jgi:redox-sensitive bicupin YhaK (pirin superfamily)
MIAIRKAAERGHFDHGWLDTWHTFSFANYRDPRHMGFGRLRVINEDFVAPGQGFGTHPHHDMEIVTYILEGALEHKDSMGTGSVIRRGDVQRMTAGTGVRHSEFNPSPAEPVHLLQIWILPEKRDLTPEYEQRAFSDEEKRNRLRRVASRDGRDGSLRIHQDVDLFASLLDPGTELEHALAPGRVAWVQVASGGIMVNGERLDAGDGAALSDETSLLLRGGPGPESEILVFDMG